MSVSVSVVMKTLAEVEIDMLQEESRKLDLLLMEKEAELMLDQQNVENERDIKDKLLNSVYVNFDSISEVRAELAEIEEKESQLKKEIDNEKLNRAFVEDYVDQLEKMSIHLRGEYYAKKMDLECLQGEYLDMKISVESEAGVILKAAEEMKKTAEDIIKDIGEIKEKINYLI